MFNNCASHSCCLRSMNSKELGIMNCHLVLLYCLLTLTLKSYNVSYVLWRAKNSADTSFDYDVDEVGLMGLINAKSAQYSQILVFVSCTLLSAACHC